MPLEIRMDLLHHFVSDAVNDHKSYQDYLNADENYENQTTYGDQLTEEQWTALKAADLFTIVADVDMSTQNLGGDDILTTVDETLAAVREGYRVCVWYGPNTETLAVGYRPEQITPVEPPEGLGEGTDEDDDE